MMNKHYQRIKTKKSFWDSTPTCILTAILLWILFVVSIAGLATTLGR